MASKNIFHVEDQKLNISAFNELWILNSAYGWVSYVLNPVLLLVFWPVGQLETPYN